MASVGTLVPRLPARRARSLLYEPWIVALLAGAVIVTIGRVGPDWPAQDYRTWFAQHVGLRAWNGAWYAGHALPSYSVLFPPITAVLGAQLSGLMASTATVWAGSRLIDRTTPAQTAGPARLLVAAKAALALSSLCCLLIGQLPFLLGVASGLLALVALHGRRGTAAAVFAMASSLASPLAGLFLLCIGVGCVRAIGPRRAFPLAAAGVGAGVATLLGNQGTFPFEITVGVAFAIFVALCLLLLPTTMRVARDSVLTMALVAVALSAFPNAIGGNVTRLAQFFALPFALWAMASRSVRPPNPHTRHFLFLAASLAALIWVSVPTVSAVARSSGDPSTNESFYSGLLSFLATQDPRQGRLEIPFTREHWEASFVAPHFALARGWERQLDIKYNAVLYHPLSATTYRAWLDESAVQLVALPRVPLDYGGVAERSLLAHPPSYLSVVYADRLWTVYRVERATHLFTGTNSALVRLGTSSFTVRFFGPGSATMKIHASPLWRVNTAHACLAASTDGWLHIDANRADVVTVTATITPAALIGHSPSTCDNDHG